MANEDVASVDRTPRDDAVERAVAAGDSLRLVPPAVTPVSMRDVIQGVRSHRRGVGRDEFRTAVASLLDARAAATYTSYRGALSACFGRLAADDPGRDTVLIPAFASQDFAAAIERVGLSVARYDVDPETLSMDLASVETAISPDTLALVSVALLGYPSPMPEVSRFCATRPFALVEAVGYALGSTVDGSPLGSFGDYAVLNFQEGKPIPVGGGMVVSRDDDALTDAGRPAAAPNVGTLAGYAAFSRPLAYRAYAAVSGVLERLESEREHLTTHATSPAGTDTSSPGPTMSNFQGAVGRRVLDRREGARRRRAETARYYRTHLDDVGQVDHVRPLAALEHHQYVRYPLLLASSQLRADVKHALRRAGVQTSAIYDWPPLESDRYPGAAAVQRRILTLPTHPYTRDRDRRRIVRTIRDVVDRS